MTESDSLPRYIAFRFDWGYCVWDRFRHRVADGVFEYEQGAQHQADRFNEDPALGSMDHFEGETGRYSTTEGLD